MLSDERIIEIIRTGGGEPLSVQEIAWAGKVRSEELTALKRRLRELVREGRLERAGRRYVAGAAPAPAGAPAATETGRKARRAEEPGRRERAERPARGAREGGGKRERAWGPKGGREVVGVVHVRPEGYGFLARSEGPKGEDLFLPPGAVAHLMDGDKVRARIVPGRYGRDVGELIEILAHRRRHLLGIYRRHPRGAYVEPLDPRLPVRVRVEAHPDALEFNLVKVAITRYAEAGELMGEVERIIGPGEDPLAEALEVAYRHGFSDSFPLPVEEEADRIPEVVREEETLGRQDLRALPLVTIDGPNAQDFDDAVFAERLPHGGYRLLVAIADVAHYVREGTSLDAEALWRGTSVYFPNLVLPMLPERLSNGICSLNPGVDRLCMVCEIFFDAEGRPLESSVFEGVMQSHARCTYDRVAALLDGQDVPELTHVAEHLQVASELAKKLHRQRVERGALDFDLPEAHIVLGEDMLPLRVERQERNWAHRLIEEMMLAANEAVARGFASRGLPTLYRVHGEPDPEKLALFADLARALGFHLDVEEAVPPERLGALLRQIEGSPQQKVLNMLLLRAMMQAVYTPENIGHYGLGAAHYLHFTSPIRRYPDLVVHRLLKEQWSRAGRALSGGAVEKLGSKLEGIAVHASDREKAATQAEREIDQYYKCLYVQDQVGERHDGTITGVAEFGFFVELDRFLVEGLVRADELGAGFRLDPVRYRLVFPNGRSFGVGERVRVEIAAVDLIKRQVSMVLVADEEGRVLPSRDGAKGRAARLMAGAWPDAAGGQGRKGAAGGGRRKAAGGSERPRKAAPARAKTAAKASGAKATKPKAAASAKGPKKTPSTGSAKRSTQPKPPKRSPSKKTTRKG